MLENLYFIKHVIKVLQMNLLLQKEGCQRLYTNMTMLYKHASLEKKDHLLCLLTRACNSVASIITGDIKNGVIIFKHWLTIHAPKSEDSQSITQPVLAHSLCRYRNISMPNLVLVFQIEVQYT